MAKEEKEEENCHIVVVEEEEEEQSDQSSDGFEDDLLEHLEVTCSSRRRSFYSVIGPKSILAEQNEKMRTVSNLFGVKEQQARTLLIFCRWNVDRICDLIERRGRERLFKEAGVPVASGDKSLAASGPSTSSSITCNVCYDDVSSNAASVMDCGHCFCNDCWTQHFIVGINGGGSRAIRCISPECHAICDEAVVRSLLGGYDAAAAERFDRSLLVSYVEDNDVVKWCPSSPHCGNAVRVKDTVAPCEVVCSCGLEFCFNCLAAPHSPATCAMQSLWTKRCDADSDNLRWISDNVKSCPKCHKPVEKKDGCNYVTCLCKQPFCWKCGCAIVFDHTRNHQCNHDTEKANIEKARRSIYSFMHYYIRHKALSDSFAIDQRLMHTVGAEISNGGKAPAKSDVARDSSWMLDGARTLLASRRLLPYTYTLAFYVFDDDEQLFHGEMTDEERDVKMRLLEHYQQQLEANVEKLSGALSEFGACVADDVLVETRRRRVENLSAVVNNCCREMYGFIEQHLLGSLQKNTKQYFGIKLRPFSSSWLEYTHCNCAAVDACWGISEIEPVCPLELSTSFGSSSSSQLLCKKVTGKHMQMASEGSNDTQSQDVRCLMEVVNSNKVPPWHKRSKSDSYKSREDNFDSSPKSIIPKLDMEEDAGRKKTMPDAEAQRSLQQEILQLEERLKDQLTMRCALEKALGYNSSTVCSSGDNSMMPKPTKELIREIAVLELEVMHLEQYLLSLYRKAFDQQKCTFPSTGDRLKVTISTQSDLFREVRKLETSSKMGSSEVQSSPNQLSKKWASNPACEVCDIRQQGQPASVVHRSHSALSQHAVSSARIAPSEESITRALRSCHSQPLSFLEEEQSAASMVISLAEYLGTSIADLVPDTPNKLSETMVGCMSAIYCKITDPPLVEHALSTSPTSSVSSISVVSPQYLGDIWSPYHKKETTLDSRLINPFRVEGLKEFSGPYNTMVEIPLICRERQRLRDVEGMLQNYRSILQRLETVDPKKMNNEERIAFWINIHNALMMHAYIEYGIPQNNLKKTSMLVKASCNIGGRTVNAAAIQNSILGCRNHFAGQWLRTLLHPRIKHKSLDEWQAFAIEQKEPLVHFALCSGSHSDPAVRIYSPQKLFQQLELAKEEFIRASVGIWKEQKILLPKVIDLYAKDMKLNTEGLLAMIQDCLPETLRMAMQRCQQGRSNKIIDWVPHNFNFRYLLSREVAIPLMN